MSNTYTKRDNYTAIRNFIENATLDNETQDRWLAFIDHEIELLNKANSYTKKKKASATDDALTGRIIGILADNATEMTTGDVVAALNDATATQGKVSYRLTKLADAGLAVKGLRAVKEGNKTTHKINTYTFNSCNNTDEEAAE